MKQDITIHNYSTNEWGHAFYLNTEDKRRLYGFGRGVKVGDKIVLLTNKVYSVKSLEYCKDPWDMYFCDVEEE